MIFEFPAYLNQFHCVGGACPETCCAGWEVELDDESAETYRAATGEFGAKLRAAICRDSEGTLYFPLTENGRCPFLDRENLCEIYTKLGEDALCRICTEYPRYYRELGAYEQIDVSLSCPEAARLFFAGEGPVRYQKLDAHEAEEEEPDLIRKREEILAFRDRAIRAIQEEAAVDPGPGNGCGDALKNLREVLRKLSEEAGLPEETDAELLRVLESLEVIGGGWTAELTMLRSCITAADSEKTEAAFHSAQSRDYARWFSRLAVYFLFRYSIDAADDGGLMPEIRFLRRSLRAINLMGLCCWREKREKLTLRDMIRTAGLYSREVEHSEENVARMKENG